ncbi:MAG: hypothetical protein HOP29_09185 [Phycisphaerales bacterium]|nr:hypothetical protein [Phycisphaerales bacterium]
MQRRTRIVWLGIAFVGSAACISSYWGVPGIAGGFPADPSPDFDHPTRRWLPVGTMDRSVVRESSGIVASRRHPGIFWTHSDSLNEPMIFAVTLDGKIVSRVAVEAVNWDWEDIAIDDDGRLYIGDTGNNYGWFHQRTVYRIPEPDPAFAAFQRVAPTATWHFAYSDNRFDAEGLFVRADRAYVVSKHDRGRSRVYRIDSDNGETTAPVEVASIDQIVVTGADVSADGRRLVVCGLSGARRYQLNEIDDGSFDLIPLDSITYPLQSVEACCFDGDAIVLTNEGGRIYRVTEDDFAAGVRFQSPLPEN